MNTRDTEQADAWRNRKEPAEPRHLGLADGAGAIAFLIGGLIQGAATFMLGIVLPIWIVVKIVEMCI